MLGDGGIFYATAKSAIPRFEFSLGKDQLEFAVHMANLFKAYAVNTLKLISVKAIKSGKDQSSFRFKTRSIENCFINLIVARVNISR